MLHKALYGYQFNSNEVNEISKTLLENLLNHIIQISQKNISSIAICVLELYIIIPHTSQYFPLIKTTELKPQRLDDGFYWP